jgi:hypothetical protein
MDVMGSLDVFYRNTVSSLMLFIMFFRSRRLDFTGAMLAMLSGFAFSGGLNLVTDKLLNQYTNTFSETRFDFLGDRWAAPLARSSFALSCASSVGVGVFAFGLLKRIWRNHSGYGGMVFATAAAAVAIIVTVRCQFRAQLVTILAGIALGLLPRFFLRPGSLAAAFAFLFVPSAFIGGLGDTLLYYVRIDLILQRIGSSDEGASTLSDRNYLYQYGWDRIVSGANGVFGDGPYLRDSWPGLGVQEFNFTLLTQHAFHNGLLDILVVYGLIVGMTVLSFGIIIPAFRFAMMEFGDETGGSASGPRALAAVFFVCWLAGSTIDSGLAYGPEFFGFFLIPLFAAMGQRSQGIVVETLRPQAGALTPQGA